MTFFWIFWMQIRLQQLEPLASDYGGKRTIVIQTAQTAINKRAAKYCFSLSFDSIR